MQSSTTVIAIITVQQGIFALAWMLLGLVLNLVRRPSLHWGLAAVIGALGMGLIALRGSVPDWLGYPVAAWLVVLMACGLRRGVRQFVGSGSDDVEQVGVLVLAAGGLFLFSLHDPSGGGVVLTTSAASAWTLLRVAQLLYGSLHDEFGRATTFWLSLPFSLLGAAFAFRFGASIVWPELFGRPLNQVSAFNASLALGLLMVGLVLHLGLAFLVLARIIGELRRLSNHDPLTGLLNRRALQERLHEANQRAARLQEPFALVMLDIDHFKRINDSLGHAGGDHALKCLAREMRRSCREIDHAARLGGEEFCLLLAGCDLERAHLVAERLRASVAALELSWVGRPFKLTVSLGLSAWDSRRSAMCIEQLMRRADDALYQAKRAGRNQVVRDEPEALHPLAA